MFSRVLLTRIISYAKGEFKLEVQHFYSQSYAFINEAFL